MGLLPDTLKVITGDDAAQLAITILQQPKANDSQTATFMKTLYSWQPNLAGTDPENLQELISAVFDKSESRDQNRSQFADQFFNLELPEEFFEKLFIKKGTYGSFVRQNAFRLIVNLTKAPMTKEQEQTKFGQLMMYWALKAITLASGNGNFLLYLLEHPLSLEQESNKIGQAILAELPKMLGCKSLKHEKIIKILLKHQFTPQQEKSGFCQTIIAAIPHIIEKTISNPDNARKLILYLLKNPMTVEQEQHLLGTAILSGISTIPTIEKNIYQSNLINLLHHIIQHPLTQEQTCSKFGQIITTTLSVPKMLETFRGYTSAFNQIMHLLKHPYTKEQEETGFGPAILESMPNFFSRLDGNQFLDIIDYLIQGP